MDTISNSYTKTNNNTISQFDSDDFMHRHIGINNTAKQQMLEQLGVKSLDELINQIIPDNIKLQSDLNIAKGISEHQATNILSEIASKNKKFKSFIGMGYYGTKSIFAVVRNLLENPAWYTAYTPYQPEISQGRMEMLLNFQQMVIDLTGLEVANASLLDEATAAAEACILCYRASKKKVTKPIFYIANDIHQYIIDVVKTRTKYLNIEIIITDIDQIDFDDSAICILLQYPNTYGSIINIKSIIDRAHENNILVAVATDLLALTLLEPPGYLGADVVFGNSQRFGVPMGFGGPHAAFFAVEKQYYRLLPGRVIGVSIDTHEQTCYRMALQTREQHIRREKATSNICTAQALLANMAVCYAIYHGLSGLQSIAWKINRLTKILYIKLKEHNIDSNSNFFDTLTIDAKTRQQEIYQNALHAKFNLRLVEDSKIAISIDELTETEDIIKLVKIITSDNNFNIEDLNQLNQILDDKFIDTGIKNSQLRTDQPLNHPVFFLYRTETELIRYLKKLESKDYSLVHGMMPLGSCTMKLNATSQLQPISWDKFANIHPFAPKNQTQGYTELIAELQEYLLNITGFDAVSMQPNSGAQGEFTGLTVIRDYHVANNQAQRNVCLIPSSAHGTNPASATMVGMQVVIINCDASGNVDINDLTNKAKKYQQNLAALMITYPSTHGVFEDHVKQLCDIVHNYGGQVYLDGANMNAQVAITSPAIIGADVCHLNLHKTFAIPHGGGGPGMGPIGVKQHLAKYLPQHFVNSNAQLKNSVSATPFGSACLLAISWMYIKTLGKDGLKHATCIAILNANYIAHKLSPYYSILYTGKNNRVAHECIIDIRPIKKATRISEEDIAKRLMDYSLHSPTMSFPVVGTLMIEPTESESLQEIERFINAMISIRQEIINVENNIWSADNNPLVNAPHTITDLISEQWNYPYSRQQAVFPTDEVKNKKIWPSVNRVNNAQGDRNFICTCPDINDYK